MTITALPTVPQRSDSSTFSTRREPFIEALGTFRTELNSTASTANSNEISTATYAANASQSAVEASTSASSAVPNSTLAVASKDAAVASSDAALASANAAKTSESSAKDSSAVATTAASDALFTANATADVVAQKSTIRPSIRPSLNLDFSNTEVLDPRVTFTRNSISSYIDYDGLLKYAPAGKPCFAYDPVTGESLGLQIFESRTNLLTYTEDFNNAAWVKARSSISQNSTIAPDGTLTADKLVEDTTTNSTHFVEQVATTVSGTTYTFSVYVKAGERSRVNLSVYTNTATSGNFDLSGGTILSGSGTITPVGFGWFKVTHTHTSGFSGVGYFDIYVQSASGSSYTGDGTSGIYIWGAQLEVGSFATPYIPANLTHTGRTSTATFIGSNGLIQSAASGVARYNYNPLNLTLAPKLLLEEQRANVLTYSEQFDNAAWTKAAATVSANATIAPDGTMTADKLVEDSTSAWHFVRPSSVAITAQQYVFSIYAKSGERNVLQIVPDGTCFPTAYANFDLTTGTVTASSGVDKAYVEYVGGGFYRCVVVDTATSSATTTPAYYTIQNNTLAARAATYTGDGTSGIYIWGAQLEAGAYPTSYIPTTTAQVTRSADTSTSAQTTRAADVAAMTGANFTSWYRQDEGTFVITASTAFKTGDYPVFAEVHDGTSNNYIQMNGRSSTLTTRMEAVANGVTQVAAINSTVTGSVGGQLTTARSYKLNNYALSTSGEAVQTDTVATVPFVTQLSVGSSRSGAYNINGYIKRITYYPKRLSLTELIALTS